MFVTGMKDDQKIAAQSLAPSPPAQCWPTLRAARCRVTSSQSPPPALPNSFPLTVFFGGRKRCAEKVQCDWVCFREKQGR